MKVITDEHKCVAAGQCAMIAPEVYDQRDEDGVVILLRDTPAADQYDDARRAATACPAKAIRIQE